MKWFAWIVLVALAGGCGDSLPEPESEVAAELRALRAVLVEQGREPARPREPWDGAALAAALAPLREVMDGLSAHQQELQQRQLALTQEMQRWSQLLVESVAVARQEEGASLTLRLQQLETALRDQQQRHQQVEILLQGALDRTADQLENFLRRLDGGAIPPSDAATPPPSADPAAQPPGPQPGGGADGAKPAKTVGSAPRARRARSDGSAWWWGGTTVLALGLCVVCFRRLRREPARRLRGADAGSRSTPVAADPDPGVQEIWAAAALLGEAVGRLRESTSGAPDGPATATGAHVPSSQTDGDRATGDDFIVLDDELLRSQEPLPDAPDRPSLSRRPAGGALPEGTVCHIRTADPVRAMQAVLQVLGEDPRVLRRPEPLVRCGNDSLEVTFRALPGLPAGERTHLEQRLRDACA